MSYTTIVMLYSTFWSLHAFVVWNEAALTFCLIFLCLCLLKSPHTVFCLYINVYMLCFCWQYQRRGQSAVCGGWFETSQPHHRTVYRWNSSVVGGIRCTITHSDFSVISFISSYVQEEMTFDFCCCIGKCPVFNQFNQLLALMCFNQSGVFDSH